ncbi:UNVERIFIED_CONTAM: hypothetical protein Cloal_2786 [Acetivibrio alkalicellulosi]
MSIEVQIDVLAALSRDYSRYGESVYGIYKNGLGKIERELESIRINYRDYRNVINKVYVLQKELKEIESKIRYIQGNANDLSRNLYYAADYYAKSVEKEKNIIKNTKSISFDWNKKVTTSLVYFNSNDSDSSQDSIFDKVINYITLILGIQKRTNESISDLSDNLNEIMSQYISNPGDYLEMMRKILITINTTVQEEWNHYHDIYSSQIRNLQQSLSDFGINVNLDSLTDVELNDFLEYLKNQGIRQESGSFQIFDPDRGGRMWDQFLKEPYVILNPVLMTDFTTEFFFTDVVGADVETYRFWRHMTLNGLGLVPKFGAIADVANSLTYMREGEWSSALKSLFFAVPGIGDLAGVINLGSKAGLGINLAGFIDGVVDELTSRQRNLENNIINTNIESILDEVKDMPHIMNKVNNSISYIESNVISEISQMDSLQDLFELPKIINVSINDRVNHEWNEFMDTMKNLQNSMINFAS